MSPKLGIINAVDLAEEQIGGLTEPEKFRVLLDSVGAPFEIAVYTAVPGGQLPPIEAADAYLITGSPSGVYDSDLWIDELGDFIRRGYQAGRKLVGICFGHQIIAHSLGGRAEKAAGGWGLGLKPFDLFRQKAWMQPGQERAWLNFVHQDQVTALPPGAELLGGSNHCRHVMYAIGEQVLGIQGHPEYTPALMGELLAYLGDHYDVPVDEALASLARGQPDNQRVASWIVNFLQADN